MIKHLLALFALFAASAANAQSVVQSGTITPGHGVKWVTNGVVGDAGTSTDGTFTSLGVQNNGGKAICVNTGPSTDAGRQQFCLQVDLATGGKLSIQNFGTAPAGNIGFVVNGVSSQLALVALPTTIGDAACFTSATGAMADCGFAPLTNVLTSAHLWVGNASNIATDTAVTGDWSITNTGVVTVGKVNGVSYPASPSTGTIPVVTAPNTVTYQSTLPTGSFANPTATVGPTATNGAAVTAMRSDAAPAIDLTATYAWTGPHSWTRASLNPLLTTSQTLTGTATSGQYYANLINILDTVDSSGTAVGGNFGLFVQHVFGGTGTKGNKQAIYGSVGNNGGATTNTGGNYVGVTGYAFGINSDGGTNTGSGARGSFFGMNPGCSVPSSAATNLLLCTAMEANVAVAAGATLNAKVGIQIVQSATDATSGTVIDTALRIANQVGSVGWNNGILFDNQFAAAVKTTGCAICAAVIAPNPAWTIDRVLDFSAVTITTNFLKSNGFSVDGSGNLSARRLTSTVATGTSPLVVTSTTNVANLNASSLNGATFAAPGAIGGGTPGTGAFTTLSTTGNVGIGAAPLSFSSLYVANTVAVNAAVLGLYFTPTLQPQNNTAYGIVSQPAIDTRVADTIPNAIAIYSGPMTKSGTGTITAAYSLYLSQQTIGATNFTLYGAGGIWSQQDATDSTTTTTGSIQTLGGLGVVKNITAGGTVKGSGFIAGANTGVTTVCTVTAGNTLTFTGGILTTKGANCT